MQRTHIRILENGAAVVHTFDGNTLRIYIIEISEDGADRNVHEMDLSHIDPHERLDTAIEMVAELEHLDVAQIGTLPFREGVIFTMPD